MGNFKKELIVKKPLIFWLYVIQLNTQKANLSISSNQICFTNSLLLGQIIAFSNTLHTKTAFITHWNWLQILLFA